ncbi:MAG: hypothetical protein ABI577_12750 [bacterium]
MASPAIAVDHVTNAQPPKLFVKMSNIFLKVALRTPLAKAIQPLAVVSFSGRRSGRPISVVVGWHSLEGTRVVFTPAPWRVNFSGSALASVRHLNQPRLLTGRLITDPTQVADALNRVIDAGTSPKALALRIPKGHLVTPTDVVAVNRAMVQFRPVSD